MLEMPGAAFGGHGAHEPTHTVVEPVEEERLVMPGMSFLKKIRTRDASTGQFVSGTSDWYSRSGE